MWYFIVILICVSLTSNDVEHLFTFTGHLYVSSEETAAQVLCPLCDEVICLVIVCYKGSLYIWIQFPYQIDLKFISPSILVIRFEA